MFGSLPSIDHEADRIRNEKSSLSISELVQLSDAALQNSNFDRAIMHLETVKKRLEVEDPRYAKITERIDLIKKQQL